MTTDNISLGEQWRIYREEGLQSLQNRSRASNDEQKRIRKLSPLKEVGGRLEFGADMPLVLNVAYLPAPSKRLATHTQLFDRLNKEKKFRTVALAYPRSDGWSLEVWSKNSAGIFNLGDSINPADAIATAARLLRARIIHIEGLRGLPLHLVNSLDDRDYEIILSVHDFTPFCARPHLIEKRSGRFCDYSTDMARCAACLKGVEMGTQKTQTDYRKVGTESIRKSRVLVFPSAFMQREFRTLFPRRQAGQLEVVLAPATSSTSIKPWNSDQTRIAFVGGVYIQSGGHFIAPTMEQIWKRDKKAKGFVYGTGDSELMGELRKTKGLSVQGYYRHGTLASLLAKDKIAIAVFPSIWADPYGLVVDECLAVGVPVVAFDTGAVADRLNFWEVGRVVRKQHGPPGLATAVFDSFGLGIKVPRDIIKAVPSTERVARRHWEMYKSLRVRIS